MTSAVPDGHGTLAQGVALTPDTAEQLGGLYARIVESVQSVLYADDDMVQLAVGCLLAQGHLLVEDLPGPGEDHVGQGPRPFAGPRLPPGAVHGRPLAR